MKELPRDAQEEISLDKTDLAILREIQEDSGMSNTELARRISLSQPATHTRLKRLEAMGVIRGNVALLDRDKLGLDMLCFIHIRLQAHSTSALDRFQSKILKMPEVLECYHLTGQFDYLLKVVMHNRKELGTFVRENMIPLDNVAQISTSVVLFEVKSSTCLPLPDK